MNRPAYSIFRFRNIKSKVSSALRSYSEQEITVDNRALIVEEIEQSLPVRDEDITHNRLRFIDSVLEFSPEDTLTPEVIDKLSTVIAGCEREMESGKLYKMWNAGDKPVWASLFIDTVEPVNNRGRLYRCILYSCGGPSSSKKFTVVLPGGLLQIIIRSCGGKKYGEYKDVDAGGLWFTAVIATRGTRLKFEEIHGSHSQEKHNKKILKAREGKCIKGLFKDRCLNCWLGRHECYLSRHAKTYPKGVCRNTGGAIGEHKGYIVDQGYCLHCLTEGLLDYGKMSRMRK